MNECDNSGITMGASVTSAPTQSASGLIHFRGRRIEVLCPLDQFLCLTQDGSARPRQRQPLSVLAYEELDTESPAPNEQWQSKSRAAKCSPAPRLG